MSSSHMTHSKQQGAALAAPPDIAAALTINILVMGRSPTSRFKEPVLHNESRIFYLFNSFFFFLPLLWAVTRTYVPEDLKVPT